jgi:four helix bundle protein
MKENDIKILDRSYQFALRIIKIGQQLPESNGARIIGNQLLRAGTSVGANIEEAVGAYSKPEFTHKMSVALKEARESHYWLRPTEGLGYC